MELSRNEASAALAGIEAAGQKARASVAYRTATPILILWGILWATCFSITQFAPRMAGWAWLIGNSVGLLASALLGWILPRRGPVVSKTSDQVGLRVGAFWLALFAFGAFWLAIFWPWTGGQFGVFAITLIMLAYVAVGLWLRMTFMVVLGLVVAVLAGVGYFVPPITVRWLNLWLAITGGGALLIAGVWSWLMSRRG